MGKRLINVDEVEEIVPVLVGKLLENNLITEEQKHTMIEPVEDLGIGGVLIMRRNVNK